MNKTLGEMKGKYYEMERVINREAESVRNHLEDQMKDLIARDEMLKENKEQIYTNMNHLDDRSKGTVLECFKFVNENLSKIFGMLLPGAQATMELIGTTIGRGEKKQESKGIQMKIGFNGKWKESLSELSGGQRSLLALSFLLSMLKYRPAPFYILDEIDSAMDLSHTENIGYIISRFFPESQFIVISLKGGLFNAANVLFRTTLVDGRSQILRYDLRKDKKERQGSHDKHPQQSSNRKMDEENKENILRQANAGLKQSTSQNNLRRP